MTRITLAALACGVVAATGAMAQSKPQARDAPRSSISDDNLPASVPPKVSTLAPIRGISGPRLEPGAILCGTEEDLQRRGEVARRISDGETDPGDPMAGCRLVTQERGVEVLVRRGLGRIQVKMKPTGQVGWTDAYLP